MVNYFNAECYKALHRKYLYIFMAVILALAGAFMLLLRVEGMAQSQTEDGMLMVQRVAVSDLMNILTMSLSMGLYFLMIAADIVFSDQYKYNTLKNEVSYGLPRVRIYLGKLIASALTAVVLCAVLIGGYLGLGCILFPVGEAFGAGLATLAKWLLVALPLWLGGLGFFTMLQFLLRGSTAATVVYVMVVAFLGSGFMELMEVFLPTLKPVADLVRTISLNTPLALLGKQSPESVMGYAWTLGMSWLAVSTAIGLAGFRKKEIN